MNLDTPRQRIAVLAIVLGFVAIIALVVMGIVTSLSDANVESLGHWLGDRSTAMWGFTVAAISSIATYLFGHRAGRKTGEAETFNSAIATAAGHETGDQAAQGLRQEAEAHGIKVMT